MGKTRTRLKLSSPLVQAALIGAAGAVIAAIVTGIANVAVAIVSQPPRSAPGAHVGSSGHFETRYSKRGYPIQMWVRDMPRLDDSYLKCVVYLYPDERSAETGERIGGTGFLIGAPVSNPDRVIVTTLLCLMTNKHVANNGNCVVRTNTKDGKTDIFTLDERNWIFHPDGDDLAVYPIGLAPLYPYPYMEAGGLNCISKSSIEGLDVGIGDEVFTVGRFIAREGVKINIPALRFGTISQMPIEPVTMEDGFKQECFLIEVRSLSGFSGSPVFLYIPPQTSIENIHPQTREHMYRNSMFRQKRSNMQFGFGPILLGVSFSYFYSTEEVRSGYGSPMHEWYVRSNTGMMGVIPGWKVSELILGDEIMKISEKITKELFKGRDKVGAATTSAKPSASPTDENPKH